eukprot:Pgem_evm1s10132
MFFFVLVTFASNALLKGEAAATLEPSKLCAFQQDNLNLTCEQTPNGIVCANDDQSEKLLCSSISNSHDCYCEPVLCLKQENLGFHCKQTDATALCENHKTKEKLFCDISPIDNSCYCNDIIPSESSTMCIKDSEIKNQYSGLYQGKEETGCSFTPQSDPRCTVDSTLNPNNMGFYMGYYQTGCSYPPGADPKECTLAEGDMDPQAFGFYGGVYQTGCSYSNVTDPKWCSTLNENPYHTQKPCCADLEEVKTGD